ncbi:hypothetical protein [Dyadobacter sp. OTU695]|uniref:hypothetical protein n=1 Tax=Dyadobacter sp. OTU695 TaxID=3043860 RepID=UPI00313EEC2D
MAYGVRWYSYFSDLRDAGEGNFLVEVLERDYAGTSVRVKSYGDPCAVEMQDFSDPFEPVRSLKYTFNWIAEDGIDFDVTQLYITDDFKYRIRLSKLDESDNATVLFHGYVSPINAEQPFLPKRYSVSFSGTCGLPLLRDSYYLDAFGSFVEGELSLIKIIANCLSTTELELPIHTTINLYEQGMSLGSSPLSQAIIDADGLRGMKAYDVLSQTLSSLRAFVVQTNGAWEIIRVKEQASYSGKVWKFNASGDPIGSEMRVQAAAFGREEYTPDVPRVSPTRKTVKQSIAMRNSVVTATVNPGIPVNRLSNGTFSGPVFGTVPGWNNHIGSVDWQRGGAGRPDDPYRIEFTEHIEFDPKKKKRAFKPFVYFDSGPIELNLGDFDIPTDYRKPTKIVLRGAFKALNALSCTFMLSINETEREFNDYLDDNGDWFYSKKEDRTYSVRSSQSQYDPESKSYHDLELQEFEIESKKITNYLDRPEGAIVVLRLRIFPGIQGPGYNGGNVFLSLEDLMLYVVEDTVYEGQHKYQIDTKSKIRNPNPADFQMSIADKIDITTPEQSREVNRVMTGYMTLPGGALTQAWSGLVNGAVDPTDSITEPIQKKALRETVRLLCGRRDIYEGVFKGYGLLPIHSVYSGYDEPVNPTTFFTITQWKWKPKEMEYTIKLSELNFEALPDEDIYLTDDNGGFNRMYRGSSSSSGAGGPANTKVEEIVLDDIEPFEYEILVEDEDYRVLDFAPLIMSSHTPNTLEAQLLSWPAWISEIFIYRGEDLEEEEIPDDGILQVQWIGKPTTSGPHFILMELVGPDGEDLMLKIPIEVEPSEDFIESWPPKFLPFPNLIFVKGKQQTKHLQLADYLDPYGDHTGKGLLYRVLDRPSWVSNQTIVFNDLAVTGKPTQVGIDKMLIEVYDAIDRTMLIQVNLQVVEPTLIKYFLRDLSTGAPVVVGEIVQGSGFEKPESAFDILVQVTGAHQGWYSRLVGMGLDIKPTADPYDLVSSDGSATYTIGSYLPSQVGFYDITAATYRVEGEPDNLVLDTREEIRFTLFDEAYLAKAQFELWDADSDTLLGPINPDGSSMFDAKGAVEVKMIIDGVLHDLATAILTSGGSDVHINVYTQDPAVEDVTYELFGGAGQVLAPALYDLLLTLEHESAEQYDRSISFSINKRNPQPTAVGLKLGTRPANTTNFNLITELAPSGNSITPMPANWTVLNDGTSEPFNRETKRLFELKNGGLVQQDIALYTRLPQFREYAEAVTTSDYYLFDNLDSTEIGKVHHFPSTFRVIYERFLDDEMVAQYQADFSFGPVVDIDDAPVEEPGGGLVDYVADDESLEQEDADGVRTFSIKAKGVTFVEMLDIPTLSLIGRLTAGTGQPYAVPVLNGASAAAASDTTIGTTLWVKNQLGTTTGPGLADRLAKYATNTTLTYSILEEDGINLVAQGGQFLANVAVNSNVRGFGLQTGGGNRWTFGKIGATDDFAWWRFSDAGAVLGTPIFIERATGKVTLETQLTILGSVLPPLVVNSTAWVEKLNVDLLDDHHGSYYLDWDNFTNYKSVIAGNGLTDGGVLDESVTINMGTPSTITNATTNSVSADSHTHDIETANLVAGSNITFSSPGTNVILGSTNITINAVSMPWTGVTGKPITIADFGIVDGVTFDYLDFQLLGKEDNFSKGTLVEGAGIDLSGTLTDRLVGSGNVTISLGSVPWASLTGVPTDIVHGTGIFPQVAVWDAGGGLVGSAIMFETGTQISVVGNMVVNGEFIAGTGTLPASGSSPGVLWYNDPDNRYYFWNGTAWKKIEVL